MNKLDQARRQVFATEMDAGFVDARQQAVATREKLTRLMGLWQADLDAYLPSALPSLPGSTRSLRAIEQDALNSASMCRWRGSKWRRWRSLMA